MTPRRHYNDYLHDILDGANYALQFIEGVTYSDFAANTEKLFAAIRALEIIGEAAAHIPDEVQRREPQIPWQDMIGMRNVLIHGYFGVDSRVIWRTVNEDIPPLIAALEKLLQSPDP